MGKIREKADKNKFAKKRKTPPRKHYNAYFQSTQGKGGSAMLPDNVKEPKGADWKMYPVNLMQFAVLPDGTVEFAVGVPDSMGKHFSKCVGRGNSFMEAMSDAFKPTAEDPRDIGAVVKAAFLLGHQYGNGTLRVSVRDANGNETDEVVGHGPPPPEWDS